MVAKIARHLESHASISEIARVLALPKASKERKKELERLRLKGNYYHNIKVLETKRGEIIPYRRSREKLNAKDFLPCPSCLGFFKKEELWKHHKVCSFKKETGKEKKYNKLQGESRILLTSELEKTNSQVMCKVKAGMKQDEISKVAQEDSLITKFGEILLERVGLKRSREVFQSMRELARLCMELQKKSEDKCNLQDYLNPSEFDAIIAGVQSLCQFSMNDDEQEKEVGIPSLALRLGHSLKKCSFILKGQALRNKDTTAVEDQGYFEQLMENEWNNNVSYHSLSQLSAKSRNKIDLMPLTSDLEILRKHLLAEIKSLSRNLKEKPSLTVWQKLAEFSLCRLIIFHKRRGGEASRMLITEYKNRPDWKNCRMDAIHEGLQPLEKKLCERLDLVEIRGKRGRNVPVILTKELKEGIDLLLSTREKVGIDSRNPYIFANCKLSYLRDWEIFQKISSNKALGLNQPGAIRSTRLRKYVATVSQVLALEENELDWLARHMGHDVHIHREYYRLHTSTLELAKVSKILTTVDRGEMTKWAGKSLSEIDIQLDDEDFRTDD